MNNFRIDPNNAKRDRYYVKMNPYTYMRMAFGEPDSLNSLSPLTNLLNFKLVYFNSKYSHGLLYLQALSGFEC